MPAGLDAGPEMSVLPVLPLNLYFSVLFVTSEIPTFLMPAGLDAAREMLVLTVLTCFSGFIVNSVLSRQNPFLFGRPFPKLAKERRIAYFLATFTLNLRIIVKTAVTNRQRNVLRMVVRKDGYTRISRIP